MRAFFRNPRRVLIVVHDLVMTALAIIATLYIRFDNGASGGLEAAIIGLSSSCLVMWSMPDRLLVLPPLYGQVAFRVLAGFVEHRPRRHVSGDFAVGARLHPALSDAVRHLFLRQDNDRAVLAAADVFSRRPALRLPSVPTFAHATACEGSGCGADADRRGCGRRRRSIARHRKRCGQESAAGRHPVALGGRSGVGHPQGSGAGPAGRSGSHRH